MILIVYGIYLNIKDKLCNQIWLIDMLISYINIILYSMFLIYILIVRNLGHLLIFVNTTRLLNILIIFLVKPYKLGIRNVGLIWILIRNVLLGDKCIIDLVLRSVLLFKLPFMDIKPNIQIKMI